MAPAMLRRLLRTRWSAWLLAWALCLPVAQWASAAHGLLHLKGVASEERDSAPRLPVSCDLCVAAAALGAIAPGASPLAQPAMPAPHAVPRPPAPVAIALPVRTAYLSRAPPFLPA